MKAKLLGPACCLECRTVMDGWALIFVVAHIAACWPGARGSECR